MAEASETTPVIILNAPQLAENIGAVARVMANFGLSRLRMVSPRDGWPQERAWASASGADWPLDNAKLYTSVADAVADLIELPILRQGDLPKPALIEAFTEAGGPYDKAVAKRLHDNIMQVGNTVDPAQAYRNFRGRDPDVKAYLRDKGFPT